MVTDAAIEEVKSRTDLAELVSSYGVSLRRSGSNWMACCPFHGEKTPSFSINSTKGFYHCFGCGESGDAIKFVMKQEGLDFMEAVKKLAARCGVELATPILKSASATLLVISTGVPLEVSPMWMQSEGSESMHLTSL